MVIKLWVPVTFTVKCLTPHWLLKSVSYKREESYHRYFDYNIKNSYFYKKISCVLSWKFTLWGKLYAVKNKNIICNIILNFIKENPWKFFFFYSILYVIISRLNFYESNKRMNNKLIYVHPKYSEQDFPFCRLKCWT